MRFLRPVQEKMSAADRHPGDVEKGGCRRQINFVSELRFSSKKYAVTFSVDYISARGHGVEPMVGVDDSREKNVQLFDK